jgi:hypothetical protein
LRLSGDDAIEREGDFTATELVMVRGVDLFKVCHLYSAHRAKPKDNEQPCGFSVD